MSTTARKNALIAAETQYHRIDRDFALECGQTLDGIEIAYRTWGNLDAARGNAILVCHALTGSADVDNWWPGLFGKARVLDPDSRFVICSNVLGGCYGTTGPSSTEPSRRAPYASRFPRITIRDMVALQARLLDELGVERLLLVMGASLGGMQVLEWAACFPGRVGAMAPIGVGGRHSAWCIGISEAQRQAIYADPGWQDGDYPPDAGPSRGLATARMMAMCSYRSWENFATRFGRGTTEPGAFEVESYLRYQGDKLVQRFDANSYVRLTEAMDSHDVSRGRGDYEQVLSGLDVPALVVSVSSDVLYPPVEQRVLAEHLPQARYRVLESPHGHDGFLIDTNDLDRYLQEFLAEL